jgi:hypothetical protein
MDEREERANSGDAQPEDCSAAEDLAESIEPDPSVLLRALEDDTTKAELGSERARAFKQAADTHRARGDEDAARHTSALAAFFDFALIPRGERRGEGRGRFQPQWEFGGQAYPHVNAFGPEALDAIAAELARSSNPIHRSRCADFLWERRTNHRYARQAIDAYLEAAELYVANGWHDQLCDALDRAAELSLRLADSALIARSKAAAFRLVQALLAAEQHPEAQWAIDILETLLGFGRRLTDSERSEIARLAEQGAAYHSGEGDHHLEQWCLTVLARGYEALRRPDDAREARRRFAAAYVAAADRADNHLAAVHFLREAVQAYADLGDSATVEELKRRLTEEVGASESEFVTISTEVRVPTDPLKVWVECLIAGTLDEALARLMVSLVPRLELVRDRAERLRREFPLRHLATNVQFEDRKIVGSAQTEAEHERMSVIECYLLDIRLSDIQLGLAFERLEAEKGLDTETLMQFLRRGELLDAEALDLVAVGIERYFAQDYVSALHVLVPQLEDVLRGFLGKLGLATTSFDRGLTREKPLDIVLETAELRSSLGEDLTTYFEVVLIRPDALNLRNRTGHGLVKRRDCTRTNVQRVLHCYLLLVNFVVVESGGPEAPSNASDSATY